MQTIGTCSKCTGPVQVPEFWGGNDPPVPTCGRCGATAKNPYGPTIQMEPRRHEANWRTGAPCGEDDSEVTGQRWADG